MDDQLDLFGGASKTATSPIPPETAPTEKPATETAEERSLPRSRKPKTVDTPRPAEPRAAPATSDDLTESAAEPQVVGVAQLDRDLKRVLEHATRDLLVEGEVVNLHRAGSGHCYFSLKDVTEDALIDAVMYRRAPARARHALEDGQRVVLRGRVTVYAPRGRMQLIATDVVQTRRGELLEQLEKLKLKLSAEGLFEPTRKKPIPKSVRRFAVLTSRDGAAIHDVIRVASVRGRVSILLVPTPVQGATAAERIAAAISQTDSLANIDVILVTRGGGSAEDLAPYNDERVVRAIAAADTPIVSAVGHEIDISLSDLVADLRAATPSQAAEMIVADAEQRRALLQQLQARLTHSVGHRLSRTRQHLDRLRRRLGEPRRHILERSQGFDELSSAAERSIRRRLATEQAQLKQMGRRLHTQHPRRVLAQCQSRLAPIEPRLATAMRRKLQLARQCLVDLSGRLQALSPLAVLERGYAIACTVHGAIVTKASEVEVGDAITVRLHDGRLHTRVEDHEDASGTN